MTEATKTDSNPGYWREYNNLQCTKHKLIECYLSGWLPKLGSCSGRILYLDTHAGRGRHEGGEYGSPLVALRTILTHNQRKYVFGDCEIVCSFVERDQQNVDVLKREIEDLGELPAKIKIDVFAGDCFETLRLLISNLRESRKKLAPAFVFVDPYGFKVPGSLLRDLMGFERVELFINVIWRELSMAIAQALRNPGLAQTLDLVFDGDKWKDLIGLEFEAQAEACVDILRNMIGATWATHIRMQGPNNATRYMLLHLTNHDAGRDLMKECMWKVSPDTPFVARAAEDPRQQFLIQPEADLAPLRQWIIRKLSDRPRRWKDLIEEVRPEVWRESQLNQVVRELRREKIVDGRDAPRFVPSRNPELCLVGKY